MPKGEKVVIIDMRISGKITGEIKQQIRKILFDYRHPISHLSHLKSLLNHHHDDRVYVFGFNDLDLSDWKNVLEHNKIG